MLCLLSIGLLEVIFLTLYFHLRFPNEWGEHLQIHDEKGFRRSVIVYWRRSAAPFITVVGKPIWILAPLTNIDPNLPVSGLENTCNTLVSFTVVAADGRGVGCTSAGNHPIYNSSCSRISNSSSISCRFGWIGMLLVDEVFMDWEHSRLSRWDLEIRRLSKWNGTDEPMLEEISRFKIVWENLPSIMAFTPEFSKVR